MKKAVKLVATLISGMGIGAILSGKILGKSKEEKSKKVDKFKSYYNMLNQWVALEQEGKSLVEYFTQNSINTIAIYGMGEMGNRLYAELENSGIEVKYAIDKNADNTYSQLNIKSLEDDLPYVDAIVVTAIFDFSDIEEMLSSKTEFQIISLEDVIYRS